MKFLYDEDQQLLAASTRRLGERLGVDGRGRAAYDSASGMDAQMWRDGAALGWLSMLAPPAHGGGGLTGQAVVDVSALAEEWGRDLQPGPLVATNVACFAIGECGSPAQQALLADVVTGARVVTWAVAEVGADSDPVATAVEAVQTADGYRLHGTKILVESGHITEQLLVTARCRDEIIELLVDADAPGVTAEVHQSLDVTRRLAAVQFDATPAPAERRLPGADLGAVTRQLDLAAVLVCADSVGGAARVMELTVEYATDRVQFGRTIASFQAVKHRCADLLVELEGARAASRYAALAVSEDLADAPLAVDAAKAMVGEAASAIAGEGIQLHGGIGFTWDHDMHLFARRAKANEVLYGRPAWRRRRTWERMTLAAGARQRIDS